MQYRQGVASTNPTQTSYAVLGLLGLRPWTTYELARQSERSLRYFFPRAERAVYQEAKRLVRLGWAEASTVTTGRRASTVYRITLAGELALRGWLEASSAAPQIQSEALLKLFFADRSDAARMRSAVAELGRDAARVLEEFAAMASGASQFPDRMPTNVVSMRLMSEMYAAMQRWAQWAEQAVGVLEHGSQDAVERQTEQALAAIRAAPTAPDDTPGHVREA